MTDLEFMTRALWRSNEVAYDEHAKLHSIADDNGNRSATRRGSIARKAVQGQDIPEARSVSQGAQSARAVLLQFAGIGNPYE